MRAAGTSPTGWPSRSPQALARLEEQAGKRLGDRDDPLLVSVRSGRARVDAGDARHGAQPRPQRRVGRWAWRARTGNERFAWDSYRRFVQMFGNVVRGIPGERFEDAIAAAKRERGVSARHRARRRRAARADDVQAASATLRRASRRIRASSCGRRSAPCSTPGWATARSPTGASTASPTTGAPPSTSSRWCSATRATRPAPASRSAATR